MTEATTSAGTEGRPRPEGNRSSNIWSGNSSWRWSARNASTLPWRTNCRHNALASSSSRLGSLWPCTCQFSLSLLATGGIPPCAALFNRLLVHAAGPRCASIVYHQPYLVTAPVPGIGGPVYFCDRTSIESAPPAAVTSTARPRTW